MRKYYPLLLIAGLMVSQAQAQQYDGNWEDRYHSCRQLQNQGNYLQSDSLAQLLVSETKTTYGENSEPYLQSLTQLVETQEKRGRYQQAASLCREALALTATLKGPRSREFAKACSEQGWLSVTTGDYQVADSLLNLSLDIQRPLGAEAQTDYAKTLDRLGLLAVEQQDYEAAQSFYTEAALLRADAKSLDYGQSLYHLGEWYLEVEELETALQYLDSARVVIEAAVGTEHPENAFVWNHYGRVYQIQDDFTRSKEAFLRALAIREKSLGKEHPAYARSLENLGNVYQNLGEYEKAEECYLKAKEINFTFFGSSEVYAKNLLNLGVLYESLGNLEEAENSFLQSYEIYAQSASISNGLFSSLLSLARVYESKDNLDKAETYYRETIRLVEENYGNDNPSYAMVALDLAAVLSEREAYEDAERFYQQSLAIVEEYYGSNSSPYATVLNNLAILYRKQYKLKEAESLYLELLAIDREVLGARHPDYIRSLYNLARLYSQFNENQATHYYQLANAGQVKLVHNYYSGFDEATRLKYLTSAQSRFDRFFSYASHHPSDQALATEAQNLNLAIKNLAIDYSTLQRVKAFTAGDPELEARYEEWKDLRRQLAGAQSMTIDELVENGLDLDSLENAAETLEKTIGRSSRGLAGQFNQVQPDYSFEDLRRALGPREAAVDFVHFNYYNTKEKTDSVLYIALIMRSDYETPRLLPLLEEQQIKALTDLAILQDGNNYIEAEEKNKEVYRLVWQPLEPYLVGVKKVYLSPSGLLHRVAFGGLRSGRPKGKFLADQYQITYRGALRGMTAAGKDPSPNQKAVLLGGADFSGSAASPVTGAGFPFAPLPGTEAEVKGIRQTFQKAGWEVTTYTGAEAREEAVKSQSGAQAPGILHIASHGFFLSPLAGEGEADAPRTYRERLQAATNPLFRSGLVFTGVKYAWEGGEPVAGQDDGVLTAYEISNLDLYDTDLVVLSACQTGRGDLYDNEGVFGMQRAFRAAGADHLIASLWQIPDEASSYLMGQFYRSALRGKSYPKALKYAKRKTRKKFNRPFYWAGFILID